MILKNLDHKRLTMATMPDGNFSNACALCPAYHDSFLLDLSNEELDQLKSQCISIHYKKGQSLFLQHNRSEGMFCLKSGQVKITFETSLGDPMTVKIINNVGTIGQHCLCLDRNAHSAICLSDTQTCFFPKRAVRSIAHTNTSFSNRILSILQEDNLQLQYVIGNLRSKSIQQRVAEALLHLERVCGKNNLGYIQIDLTKEELSRIVGASVESVFRTLSEFKTQKWIKTNRRKIQICNQTSLLNIINRT
jgi:CRP-like cAMP-binding protein